LINLAELVTKTARHTPHALALIDAQRGASRTFGSLSGRVACLAASLCNMFGSGQRIAVLSSSGFEMVELYFACAASGSLLFPMSTTSSTAQLSHALQDVDPVAIFYDATYQSSIDALRPVIDARVWISWESGCESGYEELLSRAAGVGLDPSDGPISGCPNLPAVGSLPSQPFIAISTAGADGVTKTAVHSQFSYGACVLNYLAAARIAQTDVHLTLSPLSDLFGYIPMLAYLALGRPVVIANVGAQQVGDVIREERVSSVFATTAAMPVLLGGLCSGAGHPRWLRQVEYGGSPSAIDAIRGTAGVVNVDLLRIWGTPEMGVGMYLGAADHRVALAGIRPDRLSSYGRGALLSTVEVLDETSCAVPRDERTVGEICHRGPGNFVGYWSEHELSDAKLGDGWTRCGHAGIWDAEGYIYVD
jgi:acyl-CoA synthetase (AMP-forming)/AMP-acid ligase II